MIDPNLDAAELVKQGIQATKEGRTEEAQAYLMAAVEADERNETAWLWLGGLMPELEDQIVCLENALHLNPSNEPARRKLEKLQAKRVASPPASPPPAPASTENLFMDSPAVTRTAGGSPFGALPWDNPAPPAPARLPWDNPAPTAPTSLPWDNPAPARNPGPVGWGDTASATWGNPGPAAWSDTTTMSNTPSTPNPFSSNPTPAYTSPFDSGATPAYTTPFDSSATPAYTSPFVTPPSAMLDPAPVADDDDPLIPRVMKYTPGGHPELREREQWQPPTFGVPASTLPPAAPEDAGYHPYNYVEDATAPSHDSQRFAASQFSSGFNVPDADLEQDERLECPYCGWKTRAADSICPNCGGNLYISTRVNENRSPSLWILVFLWIIRAIYSGIYLGVSLLLLNFINNAIRGIHDPKSTFVLHGDVTEAMRNATDFLIIFYGVQVGVAVLMAIGCFLRLRVFYYLSIGVLALTALSTLLAFAFDPSKSPISLIIGMGLVLLQYVMLVRTEDDFFPQKQRILEPTYHGESSAIGFYNLGISYQKAGFWALAAKAWRRAAGMSPADARIRIALATAYNRMKRYDLAEHELKEALRSQPEESRALNLMALVQFRLGNLDAARQYVAQALQVKPDDPDALANQKLIEQEAKKGAAATSTPAPSGRG